MKLRYIEDKHGMIAGVYIPIDDWNALKNRYEEIEQEEFSDIPGRHKQMLLERLKAYEKGLEDVLDLEEAMKEIEEDLSTEGYQPEQ